MAVRLCHGSWWVDFRFNRDRYRKRSPESSKAGALAYEALLRQKLARGEQLDNVKAKTAEQTFAEFSKEWMRTYVCTNNKPSEQLTKKLTLKNHLVPFFGTLPLSKIGTTQVEQYKAQKLREKFSAKTVNNHLTIIAKCLRTAADWGRLEHCPQFKHLKTVSQRLDFLSPDESNRLITYSNYPMWSEMAFLALRTGMRLGELFGLEWQDVDFQRRQLTVQRSIVRGIVGTPKNGRVRHIPLTDDVCRALYELRKPSGLVFSWNGGQPLGQSMAANAIRQMCKRAGIRQISWHILRHTFASQLASRGVPLPAIKELLGHTTIAMTMRYAHLSPSTLRDAVAVLERPEMIDTNNFGQQAVNIAKLVEKIAL